MFNNLLVTWMCVGLHILRLRRFGVCFQFSLGIAVVVVVALSPATISVCVVVKCRAEFVSSATMWVKYQQQAAAAARTITNRTLRWWISSRSTPLCGEVHACNMDVVISYSHGHILKTCTCRPSTSNHSHTN